MEGVGMSSHGLSSSKNGDVLDMILESEEDLSDILPNNDVLLNMFGEKKA